MSDQRFPGWVRYAGTGVEVAAAVAGFAALGYWIDRSYATSPWGIVVGVVLGLIGGIYNLVKASLAAVRDTARDDSRTRDDAH